MCIYYKNRAGLKYTKEEHIISAAIGGINKLPLGFVSDEFNSDISKLEQDFFRNGSMSMPRTLVGPGKRGSLSPSKATKSKIQLITNKKNPAMIAMGYTSLGKTIEIPHLNIDLETNEVSFSYSPSGLAPETIIGNFIKRLVAAESLRLKIELDDKIPVDVLLIGIQEEIEESFDCFVFKNAQNKAVITTGLLKKIGDNLRINAADARSEKYMPRVMGQIVHKQDHLRIYGKFVFNFLAYSQGCDFVMHQQFDEFRNWIAYGVPYSSVSIDSKLANPLAPLNKSFPDDCHFIYIAPGENLYARVYLYGGFSVHMVVCKNYVGNINTDGFVCCWKERKEMRLAEFLAANILS